MTLEVIGAGFGRTGTLSLKVALETLGFSPCDHMSNVIADTRRAKRWHAAVCRKARGEPIDWAVVLRDRRATVDWPGAHFWKELATAYPAAKVILTVRDPERWYDSAHATIHGLRRLTSAPGPPALPFALARLLVPGARAVLALTDDVIWDGTFHGRFDDRAHAIRVFDRHNAAVRAGMSPDRLLVYEIGEGWGPLCAFLGVEAPVDTPFPHLNDADGFRRRLRWSLAAGVAASAAAALVVVAMTTAAWRSLGAGRGAR